MQRNNHKFNLTEGFPKPNAIYEWKSTAQYDKRTSPVRRETDDDARRCSHGEHDAQRHAPLEHATCESRDDVLDNMTSHRK